MAASLAGRIAASLAHSKAIVTAQHTQHQPTHGTHVQTKQNDTIFHLNENVITFVLMPSTSLKPSS